MTRLAWLRGIPEAVNSTALAEIVERLAYVRSIGVDPQIASKIHDRRFEQFAREGAVAPAFLLSGYGIRRRRATVAAQLVQLEQRLIDAATDTFDKLVGSPFARDAAARA